MKKILTGLVALAISGMVLAGTVTIEGSKINTQGGNDQSRAKFAVSESINKTFSVSAQLASTQTENTNSIGTRLEIGGTATVPLFSSVKGYTKIGLGQKYGNFGSFTYYSIEPGFTVPLSTNLTTKVGYRYRTAAENANVNKDTTETLRVGVTYAINKKDAVGLRFDRITGDSRQDGYNLFYTRSF
jgi:hypothetical protein